MAGNTAVISMTQFSADWAAHIPIAALCERYTVTKDQVLRLKVIWNLPPRHDRSLRVKPKWSPRPSAEEDAASGESCDLAPGIAKRVADLKRGVNGIQIHGTHCRPADGTVPFTVQIVGMSQIRHCFQDNKRRSHIDAFDEGSA
jgi:hypothetical protein